MTKAEKEFILDWVNDYIKEIDARLVAERYASKEIYQQLVYCLDEIDESTDKQGQWMESCNELNKYCSECKEMYGTIYEHENYCPNCGAKMHKRRNIC